MKKFIAVFTFLVLSMAGVAFAQQACNPEQELTANGGFENPVVVTPQQWNIYPSGTSGLNWVVEWISGVTSFQGLSRPDPAQLELQAGVGGWIPDQGDQYAELDTDWDGPGGSKTGEPASVRIYEDLATVPGQTYHVKFSFSPRPDVNDANNRLEFKWDGSVIDTIHASGTGNSNTDWSHHEYDLDATSSTTRLQFADAGTPDSFGTFLDAVSVKCVPENNNNEVPEFTSIGAGLALSGIGAYLYRRRSRK